MTKHVNISYLNDLSDGNVEFVKDMINTFFERIPYYIKEFRELKNHQDWEGMKNFAHKSKSTFAMMGVDSLSIDSALIEQYCKDGNKLKEINELLNKMEPLFIEVLREMKEVYTTL